MENKPHITDDYVLSKETLTSHEAADYLGISWWNLTDGLKTSTYRFGTAKANKSGKYTYTIYAKQVYNFKHGTYDVDQQKKTPASPTKVHCKDQIKTHRKAVQLDYSLSAFHCQVRQQYERFIE